MKHNIYSFVPFLIILFLVSCTNTTRVKIGHSGGPLLPALYSAYDTKEWKTEFESIKFETSSDIGYALLSNKLDAGFVDPATLLSMQKQPQFYDLEVVGKISFQYGSTGVVSKKLDSHFDKSLEGRRFAVNSENCVLFEAFKKDALNHGIDTSTFKVTVMPFHTMVAALDADIVDVIISRPAYAAVAAGLGHRAIYKNYDVVAGDTCCPITLDQLALVLLANKASHVKVESLVKLLLKTEDSTTRADLRKSITTVTRIPDETLDKFPLAAFSEADQRLFHLIRDAGLEESGKQSGK